MFQYKGVFQQSSEVFKRFFPKTGSIHHQSGMQKEIDDHPERYDCYNMQYSTCDPVLTYTGN